MKYGHTSSKLTKNKFRNFKFRNFFRNFCFTLHDCTKSLIFVLIFFFHPKKKKKTIIKNKKNNVEDNYTSLFM